MYKPESVQPLKSPDWQSSLFLLSEENSLASLGELTAAHALQVEAYSSGELPPPPPVTASTRSQSQVLAQPERGTARPPSGRYSLRAEQGIARLANRYWEEAGGWI